VPSPTPHTLAALWGSHSIRLYSTLSPQIPPLYPEVWCGCSAAIAHTQCLDEHGVESDALLDVQLAEDVFTDRLEAEYVVACGQAEAEAMRTHPELCREIASKINSSGSGVMQQDELQILVKHLDPAFINVPTNQIQIQDPKIKALIGKESEALGQYLSITYEENWVRAPTHAVQLVETCLRREIESCFVQIKVFHSFLHTFLGLAPKTAFPPSKPGVYEVVWEGGVRYRTKPNYQSIADEEDLALPQTQFEVREFIIGDDGVSTIAE
jgi:hypothetical protein